MSRTERALREARTQSEFLRKSLHATDPAVARRAAERMAAVLVQFSTTDQVLAEKDTIKRKPYHDTIAREWHHASWEDLNKAIADGIFPTIEQSTLNFLEVELRNEHHGGETPATLRTAWDSFTAVHPEDTFVLRSWFGPKGVGEAVARGTARLSALPAFDRDRAERDLRRLRAILGDDARLSDVVDRAHSLAAEQYGTTVMAEVYTDDRQYELEVNVNRWFANASDSEILALASKEWRPSYESDAVAEYMARCDEDLAEMFGYLAMEPTMPYDHERVGFSVHVDEEDALAWLKARRPKLHAILSRGFTCAGCEPEVKHPDVDYCDLCRPTP